MDKKFASFLKDKMAKQAGNVVEVEDVEVEDGEDVSESHVIAQELISAVKADNPQGVVEAIEALVELLR